MPSSGANRHMAPPAPLPHALPQSLQAVAWLLSVPGASRTVLDVQVPYSRASLTELLGYSPQSYASAGKPFADLP